MKTSTRVILLIVLTQLATSGAWMCMNLASMWFDIAHGLNPWIALPLATVLGLIPYVVHSLWFESDRSTKFDLETIEMPLSHHTQYQDTDGSLKPKPYIGPDGNTHYPKALKPIDSGSSDFPKDVF